MNQIDVVSLILGYIIQVIHPWIIFVFALVLVMVCLADSAYVGFLFNKGSVDRMWPVKILRYERSVRH